MFTLKLYKRYPAQTGGVTSQIRSVDHISTMQIGEETLEIRVFKTPQSHPYESVYVGKRTPEMTAIDDDNHWEWGLLENAAGKTTEHFRPYTYAAKEELDSRDRFVYQPRTPDHTRNAHS